MELADFTTEELQLAYRVCDRLSDYASRSSLDGLVLAAASEVLRSAVRARTVHDPVPGQTRIDSP
jgi:hypothetical protein